MAGISSNPLGRTQQAGQGTAFIYEPLSKTNPLDKLYNSILQEKARKDKMKIEQEKLKQKSGQDLRNTILKTNSKIRMQDMGLAQQYIDEIMNFASDNPGFDYPNSPAFIEMSNMLGKLATFSSASQSQKELEKKFLSNVKDYDVEDMDRFQTYILGSNILDIQKGIEANDPKFNLMIAPREYTAEEVFKKTGFTQSVLSGAKMYKTLLYNAKTAEEQNTILDQLGYDAAISGLQNLKNMQNEGRLSSKLTDDELLEMSINHVTPLIQTTLYDPTKDNALSLGWAKLAETIRNNNRNFNFKQQQAQKEITEFNVDEIFNDAGNGGKNSLDLIRNVLEDNESFKIVNGSDLTNVKTKGFLGSGAKEEKRTKFPDGTPINENAKYYEYTKANGEIIYGEVGKTENKFADGVLGKRLEGKISQNNTSGGMSYTNKTQPKIEVGKNYTVGAGTTTKTSNSTTTTNKSSSGNKQTNSGFPIFK